MTPTFTTDLIERVVRTALFTFLSVASTTVAGVTDITTAKAALVSAGAAAMSAVVGLLSRNVGRPDTAGMF